jgi:hypothetical protein
MNLTVPLQDFLPKLKQHLLPRILSKLRSEDPSYSDSLHDQNFIDPNSILLKHDRMYQHSFIRTNYTTYDVRRAQDAVNASTAHNNIMVLADLGNECDSTSDQDHPFRYARILGVYHVNVVYVGPGMLDYQPHRMEFLWVRWYRNVGVKLTGWNNRKLDRIRFPSMTEDDAFGFIDPSDVLRSCHIIPAFARGKLHIDGKGLSHCARDSSDWVEYYVNR